MESGEIPPSSLRLPTEENAARQQQHEEDHNGTSGGEDHQQQQQQQVSAGDENSSFHACQGNEDNDNLKHSISERPRGFVVVDDDDDDNEQEDSRIYEFLMGRKCSACCVTSCPRFLALLFGVVVPLWLLIFISLFFGKLLSSLEAEGEAVRNDDLLAAQKEAYLFSQVVLNATVVIPAKCFDLYVQNHSYTMIGEELNDWLWNIADNSNTKEPVSTFQDNSTYVITNVDNMNEFLNKCGEEAYTITTALFERAREANERAMGALSFNWIRCHPNANHEPRITAGDFFAKPSQDFRPEEQEAYYNSTWSVSVALACFLFVRSFVLSLVLSTDYSTNCTRLFLFLSTRRTTSNIYMACTTIKTSRLALIRGKLICKH